MGQVIRLERRDPTGRQPAARPVENPNPDPPSDGELIAQTLDGSRRAKEQLYRRHARMVLGMAHRLLGGHEVDDVVQDTFLTAFERLHQLREPEKFRSWLGAIAVAKVRRRLRRRQLRRRLGFRSGEWDSEKMVAGDASDPHAAAEVSAIYEVIRDLAPEVRIALVLRRVEGLTIPEVAAHLEVSERTAKRRVREGIDAIERWRSAREGAR